MLGYLLSFLRALAGRILLPVPYTDSEKSYAKRKHFGADIPVSHLNFFLLILESTDSLLFWCLDKREALK